MCVQESVPEGCGGLDTGGRAGHRSRPACAHGHGACAARRILALPAGMAHRTGGIVTVPHTWQIAAATAEYYGLAWYGRNFDVPAEWAGATVRIEFEAVFHSAAVWVNGHPAGEHLRKGYTAFLLDITRHLKFGARNTCAGAG